MEFPIEAPVHCVDGPGGQSMTIIVDPATEQVVSIAVRDADRPHTAYLVPIEHVSRVSTELIELSCTRAELEQMPPFIETEYLTIPATTYSDPLSSYGGPEMMVVEHQLIPEGTLAVNRGMAAEAVDGYAGTVNELLIDQESGQISHFVLRHDHLRGKTEVTLPLTQIDRVEGSTVYLKLNKADIELTPVVQAQRLYRKDEIETLGIELIVITFEDTGQADRALQILKTMDKSGDVKTRNAAVVVRSEAGQLTFKETEDVDRRQGSLFGAVTGGLIGLLGGPAGMLLGAAAGAVTGGVAAAKIDGGFSDAYLEQLQAELAPGSSALVTLLQHQAVETVIKALADLDGQVTRLPLTAELAAQLSKP